MYHVVDDNGDDGDMVSNTLEEDARVRFGLGVSDAAEASLQVFVENSAGLLQTVDTAEAAEDKIFGEV